MSISGKTLIKRFEEYCPLELAEAGDPVGLHIGTLDKPISRVMVTLDVRPETVAEAIAEKIDLIIAKHPPIFRPAKRLTTDDPQTKMYGDLLKHDIAVYAAHTNLDIIENGLNDWFCQELGITETTFLTQTHQIPAKKLAVYVPVEEAEKLTQALFAAGAGQLGENYQECSYKTNGEGRFTPIKGANPAIGEVGQPEVVKEAKVEVVFLETIQDKVLEALANHHPYEEPAYDLFPLENASKAYGLGRVGNLAEPLTLPDFTEKVKTVFGLEGLRVVTQEPEKQITRVAICGGSGEKFYPDALKKKADVYLTGDVYYHTAHDMLANGLTVIDPGHHIEVLCQRYLVEILNQWKQENQWTVTFSESKVDTNPFKFY